MPLEQPPRETLQLKCRGSNTKSFIKSSIADKTGKDPKVEVRPSFPGPTIDETRDFIFNDLDLINEKM